MYLPKISRADWIAFIRKGFTGTGKSISEALANTIAALVGDHSYYVQQLAYLVWVSTPKKATPQIVKSATENLLAQNALLYTRDTDALSNGQHQYLKAVASDIHIGLSSKDVLRRYDLGTSANVQKIRKALVQKELIDDTSTGVYFLDPVYRLWFRKHMLRKEIDWPDE